MARILIAEDELHIIRVMAMWLQRNGHTVVEAPNGKRALEALERQQVDLVVSDIHMPQMDGFELVSEIRTVRGLELPILILSSSCEQSRIEKQMEPYRVRVYPKPFTPSRLVAEIETLLSAAAATEDG